MSDDTQPSLPGFKPLKELIPKARKPSRIKQRLIEASSGVLQDDPHCVLYQHTILCQTVMPYRNPGNEIRLWERQQGHVHLEIQAGRAMHPDRGTMVDIGLPFGPKPRMVLYHLNAEALRTRDPLVEVDDSLTAFVKRIGLDPKGRNMRIIKDQLTRLSASDFRLGMIEGGLASTVKTSIISGFQLWFPKDERQRVLWPTTVRFSHEYFESLMEHAVPLNEYAIVRLSHSAMALDIYTWLAQRLHRVPGERPQFISWKAAHGQFGQNFSRIRKFREKFTEALKQVRAVYPEARFDLDGRGVTLRNSRPPVPHRFLALH